MKEQYYIFKPTDRNMLQEYPELAEYTEFKNIRNDELVFVWHLVFDRSELDKFPEAKWRERAAKKAWGEDDPQRVKEFSAGDFSAPVKAAIERMKNFSLSARMRGKAIIDRIFADFETINKKSLTTITDVSEMKKYIDLKLDITKAMPGLIDQYERGFGVTAEERKEKNQERTESYADGVHAYLEKTDN